jgi:MotA/TolQ/ExbB proton channel family protein
MLARYFAAGGPVMYVILAAWVVVLAGIFDRVLYALYRSWRRPLRSVEALARRGAMDEARAALERERRRAARGITRIDAVSQLSTSIGLFGMVLGLARTFFSSGVDRVAPPDVLASGLAVALFTTVGGMMVFLLGQGFIIVWEEWFAFRERKLQELVEGGKAP